MEGTITCSPTINFINGLYVLWIAALQLWRRRAARARRAGDVRLPEDAFVLARVDHLDRIHATGVDRVRAARKVDGVIRRA
jgi:hypothetical protein